MTKRRYTRSAEPDLLTPAQFLALPPQPDGTTVRVLADATAGVIWTLRYRAASASAYKWEFVGGNDLEALVLGQSNTTGSGSIYSPTIGDGTFACSQTMPLVGDYDCTWRAYGVTTTANSINMAVGVSAEGVQPTHVTLDGAAGSISAGMGASFSGVARINVPTAGYRLAMMYLYCPVVVAYAHRCIHIRPARVQGP